MSEKEESVQLEIKLTLPGSVAREAEARGLLKPEFLESLLREELRRGRVDRLFEAADRLGSGSLPPLTDAEVEDEIQAVRLRQRTSQVRLRKLVEKFGTLDGFMTQEELLQNREEP